MRSLCSLSPIIQDDPARNHSHARSNRLRAHLHSGDAVTIDQVRPARHSYNAHPVPAEFDSTVPAQHRPADFRRIPPGAPAGTAPAVRPQSATPGLAAGVAAGVLLPAVAPRTAEIAAGRSFQQRLHEMIARADEVVSVVPEPRLASTFIEASRERNLRALRGGTRMRTLYHDDIANHLPSMRFVRDTVEAGAQARSLPVLPTWLTIIGREMLVVPADERDAGIGALLIRGRAYVNAALWLFDRAWREASPLTPESGTPSLTIWERKVLTQLARGAKDETAARELGVSPRTYRRHVAELCTRLGASSRFEAGARAVQAGLI